MPRCPRNLLPDGIYHVTSRGTGGGSIFTADLDRVDFLNLLERVRRRFGWRCHAYCLMGTHYHLLIETTRERLSRGMHLLNSTYARWFNYRNGRRGALFEGRYSASLIKDDDHFRAAQEYIVQSPVSAGLCTRAADWPWSKA
jgi:putative transposase